MSTTDCIVCQFFLFNSPSKLYSLCDKTLKNWSICFAECFCIKVLEALKTSFSQLEEKTKLELKLLQSDPHFWKVALRDKLLRVSQLFSSQATDQIQFNDAESRWAYLGTYTAAHATLIHAVVTSGQFEPLTEFVRKSQDLERFVLLAIVIYCRPQIYCMCLRNY